MSGARSLHNTSLAGNKRRSFSGPGSLFNRMFGSSGGTKDVNNDVAATAASPHVDGGVTGSIEDELKDNMTEQRNSTRKPDDAAAGEKKRRSSGVGRARDFLSSAKQSLSSFGGSPEKNADKAQTPIQKLGKVDPALSVPQGSWNNSAGESHPSPRSSFRVGVTEDRNKKCRRTMEDTHAYLYNFMSTPAPALSPDGVGKGPAVDTVAAVDQSVVETDNGYFAIFDGHAGTFAAEWCGKKVHILLEELIRKQPNTPIPELLDMTFTSVDQQLEKLPLKNSGCTAVIAVLRWEDRILSKQSATGSSPIASAAAAAVEADKSDASTVENRLQQVATRQRVLYTANVGDARIVLCRNGKALRLSYDHKGSDENEGKRIAGAGGLILNNRVNGVLAVTRALGDAYMKDLVTGHPYTTETVIQPDIDEFLILACDGLWDVCSDQEAVELVRQINDPQAASKALVDHALARFSTDNLSCMIVRFDSKALQQTVANEVPPIGVEGDAATRPGGVSEAQAIVMESKKKMGNAGVTTDEVAHELVKAEEERDPEPGPELNADAVRRARRYDGVPSAS